MLFAESKNKDPLEDTNQIVMWNDAVFKCRPLPRSHFLLGPLVIAIDLISSECQLTREGAKVPIWSCLYLDIPITSSSPELFLYFPSNHKLSLSVSTPLRFLTLVSQSSVQLPIRS